jgi:prevent-host-death family protein
MQRQHPDQLVKEVSPMEKTIAAYEARRKFGQLIEEAFYRKDNFVVERSGRPMAVIVPIDAYARWKRLAKERVFAMLEEVWRRTANVPGEVLEAEIEQTLKTFKEEQAHGRES